MIQRRLAVDEQLAEDRQQAAVEAHFTAKRQRCSGSAGQTVGRQRAQQPAAVGNVQRVMGGGSAPLPAEPRAELEDVAVETSPCRHFRRWNASQAAGPSCDGRCQSFPAESSSSAMPQNSVRPCARSLASAISRSSISDARGHVEFRLDPLPRSCDLGRSSRVRAPHFRAVIRAHLAYLCVPPCSMCTTQPQPSIASMRHDNSHRHHRLREPRPARFP